MTSELPSLTGKVCLVTGASRGNGKGIALILAKAGATVYITGRTLEATEGKTGSLWQTAEEIGQESAGQYIPVQCDHGNDEEVQKLFDQVNKEQNGRLDVLVNNAYSGVKAIFDNAGKPFYEQPASMWDQLNNVGLRSNYIAAWHAAKMMVPAKQGLIVNVSSFGGLRYLFNVSYGVGKAANDRMAADIAVELKKQNVACVSLWPGAVMTEHVNDFLSQPQDEISSKAAAVFKDAEDPTFSGKAVAWLASGSQIASWFPSFSVEVMHTRVNNLMEGQLPESRIEAMAHQVQAMFPHMPFNIIMDDLRHTHSLEVTIENVLEGNIAVPSVWTPPEDQRTVEDSELLQIAQPSSTASSDNLDDTGSLSAEQEDVSSSNTEKAIDEELPVMEERQQSASVEEAEVKEESGPLTQEIRTAGSGYAAAASSSSAEFSLQPCVRHTMLLKRKEAILQQARRRFLEREDSNKSES